MEKLPCCTFRLLAIGGVLSLHDHVPCLAQLASRLEALKKVRQEKEELAKLKQDPIQVNPDEESLNRLQQMRQRLQQLPQKQQRAAEGSSEQVAEAAPAAATGAASSSAAAGSQQPQEDADAVNGTAEGISEDGDQQQAVDAGAEGADPYAGMSARQRKLHELKQKLQQSRKANENAIIAERKRMKARWMLLNSMLG